MFTPEQLAAVRQEEAALAARHAAINTQNDNAYANQVKNADLYARSPQSKSGRAFINRKCNADSDPKNYTLEGKVEQLTYVQVQYFRNTKRGAPGHVIKIEWSTNPDLEKAKQKRHQTVTYFNLYERSRVVFKCTENDRMSREEAKEIASLMKNLPLTRSDDHAIQAPLFGFCTVQHQKNGTVLFPEHSCFAIPHTDSAGRDQLKLVFDINGSELQIDLLEMSQEDRKENSSLFVGYLPTMTAEEQLEVIKANFERIRNKVASVQLIDYVEPDYEDSQEPEQELCE